MLSPSWEGIAWSKPKKTLIEGKKRLTGKADAQCWNGSFQLNLAFPLGFTETGCLRSLAPTRVLWFIPCAWKWSMTQYYTTEYLNSAELSVQLPMFNYICHCTESGQLRKGCYTAYSTTAKQKKQLNCSAAHSTHHLFPALATSLHHPQPTYLCLFPEQH